MTNPYYFTDRALQVGFNITVDSHHNNHANSILTIKPSYSEIQTTFVRKIFREMASVYARFLNQYKFKHQTVFSAGFDKQDEDGQLLDEIEIFFSLNFK